MDVNLSLVSQMPKANRNVRQEADENGTTVMGAGIMVSPSIFSNRPRMRPGLPKVLPGWAYPALGRD
jgi:hypothetical protein